MERLDSSNIFNCLGIRNINVCFTSLFRFSDYREAIYFGFRRIQQTELILDRDIKEINRLLTHNTAGYRTVPETALRNSQTGEAVYTPPQHPQQIVHLMSNLQRLRNS